jgi:hypothetical protein
MREDVRIDEVWFEGPKDEHWALAARDCRERLTQAQGTLAEVERQRDYYLLLRKSWEQKWQRDVEARLAAEADLRQVQALLVRTRELLACWASSHPDPELRSSTELFLEEIEATAARLDR